MTVEEALEVFNSGCNDIAKVQIATHTAIKALEEIQQYREYKEIFESQFTEDALKLFSDKEEFSKWFERGKWHVLKCDELGREVEAYRAIGTVEGYERAIQISIENYNLYREYKAKVQEFEAIGTVSDFRELKEKATAKSPAYQGEHEKCPTCGSFCIGEYCIKCGQRILCD